MHSSLGLMSQAGVGSKGGPTESTGAAALRESWHVAFADASKAEVRGARGRAIRALGKEGGPPASPLRRPPYRRNRAASNAVW